MYEVVFFLPLFKVYKRRLDDFGLSVNYRGGEILQTRGMPHIVSKIFHRKDQDMASSSARELATLIRLFKIK